MWPRHFVKKLSVTMCPWKNIYSVKNAQTQKVSREEKTDRDLRDLFICAWVWYTDKI